MGIFWRVIFGFGALVFGVIAVGVIDVARQYMLVTQMSGFYGTPHDPYFSMSGSGSGRIELTSTQVYAGAAVIVLVTGGLSVACAYLAFRSDNDKAATD